MSDNDNQLRQGIAAKFGFDGMTKEEQEEMIDRIGALVLKGVFARSIEEMSERDADELKLLIDSGAGEEDILLFLQDRVPNFGQIAEEEAEKFREGALRAFGSAKADQ